MATVRSDVIIPEIFTPYLIEATTVRNSFLTSGVVTALDALNVTEGGDKVTIPNWKADLSGDAERLTDSTSLTPSKITADRQIGVVLHRGRAWESRDLARLAAGSDPMGAIGAKVADYIANQQQKDMIATLRGVFGALGSSNSGAAFAGLSVDAAGSGETNLGPRQIAAAEALLLEDSDKLAAIVMHPLVYADLKERKAIDYVTATDARVTASTIAAGSLDAMNAFGGSVAAAYTNNTQIPFYMGMRVIRSKDVPTSGTGSTTKYAWRSRHRPTSRPPLRSGSRHPGQIRRYVGRLAHRLPPPGRPLHRRGQPRTGRPRHRRQLGKGLRDREHRHRPPDRHQLLRLSLRLTPLTKQPPPNAEAPPFSLVRTNGILDFRADFRPRCGRKPALQKVHQGRC